MVSVVYKVSILGAKIEPTEEMAIAAVALAGEMLPVEASVEALVEVAVSIGKGVIVPCSAEVMEAPVEVAVSVGKEVIIPSSAEVMVMLDGRGTKMVMVVVVDLDLPMTAMIAVLIVNHGTGQGRPGMGVLAVATVEASREVGLAAIGAVVEVVEGLVEEMVDERAGTVNEPVSSSRHCCAAESHVGGFSKALIFFLLCCMFVP